MKKMLTLATLGLSLSLMTVSCDKNDDVNKAKIEAEAKAKAKAEAEAIASLEAAQNIAELNKIYEGLSKELKENPKVKEAKTKKEQELRDKAEAEAKAKAEAEAIKSLEATKTIAERNKVYEGLSDELKENAKVKEAKAKKEKELQDNFLIGRSFTARFPDMSVAVRMTFKDEKMVTTHNYTINEDGSLTKQEGESVDPYTYKYPKLTYTAMGMPMSGTVDIEKETISGSLPGMSIDYVFTLDK